MVNQVLPFPPPGKKPVTIGSFQVLRLKQGEAAEVCHTAEVRGREARGFQPLPVKRDSLKGVFHQGFQTEILPGGHRAGMAAAIEFELRTRNPGIVTAQH
jgi:hypothetical protein